MYDSLSTALLTDMYELTMLQSALADGTAHRMCAFEVFSRRLPNERRYGVVAGTARVLEAVTNFRFTEKQLESLDFLNQETLDYLRNYRFTGQIDGYREGELYFPYSPIMLVRGTSADGRPIIEMGSRRTNELAAVTAARAAYLAGFTATSNLEAVHRYGIPGTGTAAHAWTLLHVNDDGTPNEEAAFRAQVETHGTDTTLLVDTYDITQGVKTAIEVAGTELGAVRIDSGDLGVMTRKVRQQLDDLGAYNTQIIVSSDLDEYAIAGLRGDPVDGFGVGTSVVTGSGAPTASMVYKLVEVDGHPVAKRSLNKNSAGGSKRAIRTHRATGTAVEEIIYPFRASQPEIGNLTATMLTTELMRDGEIVAGQPTLEESRAYLAHQLVTLPWEGLALSKDEPVISTRYVGFV